VVRGRRRIVSVHSVDFTERDMQSGREREREGEGGHCVCTEISTSRTEAMVSSIAYEREKIAKQII
jgi:hypothetical protein